MINTLQHFLFQNGYKYLETKNLEMQMMIHPSYPSFKSVTDTLEYFNIKNLAVNVPKEALTKLPDCFLSLVKGGKGEVLASIIREKGNILVFTENGKKNMAASDFLNVWNPNIIAVEGNVTKAGRDGFLIKLLGVLTGLSVIGIMFLSFTSNLNFLFSILSFVGLSLSVFSLKEELGYKSQNLNQICRSISTTSSCSEVINNSGIKLLNKISFGDASIIFFSTLSIYSLFFGVNSILLIPLLCSIPVIIYSLFIQFSVKHWCILCLATAVLIFFLIAIGLYMYSLNFQFYALVRFVFVFSGMAFLSIVLKDFILEYKNIKTRYVNLARFKRDPDIFSFFISKAQKISNLKPINNEIVLGNPKGNIKIVAVTNPYCGFCQAAFESYTSLLQNSDYEIIVRFMVNFQDLTSGATMISLRLLEIYNEQGKGKMVKAYTNWFQNRNSEKWFKIYGKPEIDNSEYLNVFREQEDWIKLENILYTPVTIINGDYYPKQYGYDEFAYFVNVVKENIQLDPKMEMGTN